MQNIMYIERRWSGIYMYKYTALYMLIHHPLPHIPLHSMQSIITSTTINRHEADRNQSIDRLLSRNCDMHTYTYKHIYRNRLINLMRIEMELIKNGLCH